MLALCFASAALVSPLSIIGDSRVFDPRDGSAVSPLDGVSGKALVVVLPQLGEFDSYEMVEQCTAIETELAAAGVAMRIVGIGNADAAQRFCDFTGCPSALLRVDPDASLHKALGLHRGPGWSAPDFVPDALLSLLLSTLPGGVPSDEALLRPTFNAWLDYLAMCAGIAAPGTLPEILRGYLGDGSAPERLKPDTVVKVGDLIEIGPGVGPVRLGPFRYENAWADETGCQRPIELATVRLKAMVEVLSHWDGYVSNPTTIAQRGGTYLFDLDSGATLFEYRHRGVLTYSPTMSRPLSFLAPYIGARALNPLGLGDDAIGRLPH